MDHYHHDDKPLAPGASGEIGISSNGTTSSEEDIPVSIHKEFFFDASILQFNKKARRLNGYGVHAWS